MITAAQAPNALDVYIQNEPQTPSTQYIQKLMARKSYCLPQSAIMDLIILWIVFEVWQMD